MSELEILEVCSDIFITKIKNHHLIKQQVLDAIDEVESINSNCNAFKIYNHDYTDLPQKQQEEKKYVNIIFPLIEKHYSLINEAAPFNFVEFGSFWFQQYTTGDFHSWHNHPYCTHSNVYYVDISSDNPSTEFKTINKTFSIQAEEGMIVTFPSSMVHRSKPNKSQKTKTVIAFNCDIHISF